MDENSFYSSTYLISDMLQINMGKVRMEQRQWSRRNGWRCLFLWMQTEPIMFHSKWKASWIIIGALSITHPSFIIIFKVSHGWIKKPFMKWWKEFLNRIHKNTNVKLLLSVDDCGPHGGTLTVNIGQVKVVLLPPNVKNVYQPIEAVFSAMTKKLSVPAPPWDDFDQQGARQTQ